MAKKRFTAEEIIGKLREAEVLSAQGQSIREIRKRLGITDETYYRRIRVPRPVWVQAIPPYAIGAVAMFWVIERVVAFRQ